MRKKAKILNGNETRADTSGKAIGVFATQAITQACGHLPDGNIPVIDEAHVREAKAYVDKMHL